MGERGEHGRACSRARKVTNAFRQIETHVCIYVCIHTYIYIYINIFPSTQLNLLLEQVHFFLVETDKDFTNNWKVSA